MRELTNREQSIVDRINCLPHITISNLIKEEFAHLKFTMDGNTIKLYGDKEVKCKAALDPISDEVRRLVEFCLDCIRTLELLEAQGLLYRLQHIPNFEEERQFDGSAISTVTKEEAQTSKHTIHLFPYKGVPEKVEELDKWFYAKTESLEAFIRDGYALPGEARDRKNLKVAVIALVTTVIFSYLDFTISAFQSGLDFPIIILLLIGAIYMGLTVYQEFK